MKKTIWGILTMSCALGLFGCATDGNWNTASSNNNWDTGHQDNMQARSDNLYGSASGNGTYTADNTSSTYNSSDSSLNSSYGRTDLNARTDANGGSRATASNQVPDRAGTPSANSYSGSSSYNSGVNTNTDRDSHSMAAADSNNTGASPQLNEGSDKTKIAAALSDQDRNFMQDAGAGGMYEVQAGEKALAKSSDQRVKNIAQHMVDDHTKANQQLQALARRKGVELAGVPNADQIKMLAQLDKLNGSDFDQEYINQQKQAHQDTIAKFQSEATNGKDRDTRDWAASTLPTLRDHLNMINGNSNDSGLGSNR